MSLLKIKDLKKHYEIKKPFKPLQAVKALDGVSFELGDKKTLAVVGESGCGKSTLAKQLLKLESRTAGSIFLGERNLEDMSRKDIQSEIQMIFQDPYSSINPRKKAWQIISEPLMINSELSKKECYLKACEAMEQVGLRSDLANRYPHMFSGGQRQRIGIARALIQMPKILICDEPVSALDVSIQAQVLNLLMELQDKFELSFLFISHDLSVVRHIADEVIVMYLGKIVEQGPYKKIFENPQHPYTKALLASTPHVHGNTTFEPLSGELPSPLNPPSGCSFHKRCPFVKDECKKVTPEIRNISGVNVACHLIDN